MGERRWGELAELAGRGRSETAWALTASAMGLVDSTLEAIS